MPGIHEPPEAGDLALCLGPVLLRPLSQVALGVALEAGGAFCLGGAVPAVGEDGDKKNRRKNVCRSLHLVVRGRRFGLRTHMWQAGGQ